LTPDAIVLQHSDPDHALAGVRLVQEVGLVDDLEFKYDEAERAWRLHLPPVPVRRLEYLLELRRNGQSEVICDPANPQRAPGGVGEKSTIELAGYRRPDWLDVPGTPLAWRDLTVGSRALKTDVPVRIAARREAKGILLAHDGGQLDRLTELSHYSSAMITAGAMPPHHLVLLSPIDRNEWYSANPAYARALADRVLPTVRGELGTDAPVVALGASLGALALLHAQRRTPHLFGGMFLQSGSFFQHRFDAQESNFAHYRRIVNFVAGVRRRRPAGAPVHTVITCGIAEENLANNRNMADTLRDQGYPVRLIEVPDAHNLVAWRDAWHPHLAALASAVWTGDPLRAQDG
jgi:enterochelin esterase family protein